MDVDFASSMPGHNAQRFAIRDPILSAAPKKNSAAEDILLLMEEILHHLTCMKPMQTLG